MLSQLNRIVAWGLVAVGVVHGLVSFVAYDRLSDAALWFFSAALALIFAGLLNVVQLSHPPARTATWAARVANILLLCFVLVYAGRHPLRALSDPASVTLVVLTCSATVFSFLRRQET